MVDLAIDMGNTSLKAGIFKNSRLIETHVFHQNERDDLQKIINLEQVERVIVANVSKVEDAEVKGWMEQMGKTGEILFVSSQIKLPFILNYDSPETLGADRIAAAAGAVTLYPGTNVLVIDAGSCVTYDLVRGGSIFEGGNISPGIQMRLKAIHEQTGRLPLVDPDGEIFMTAKNTKDAIRSGVVGGIVMEMKGVIAQYKGLFDKLNIVLTGGDSGFFVNTKKTMIFVHSHLVLYGLNTILQLNGD